MKRTLAVSFLIYGLSPLHAGSTLVLSADGATVYDAANNISWLANANLAASNRFGLPLCTTSGSTIPCVDPSGSMNWVGAVAWVAAMNAAGYLGHSDWQLPTTPMVDKGCGEVGPQKNSFGSNCSLNALGSLYYNALGLNFPNTAVPIPNSQVGPFSNLQPYFYWSQSADGGLGQSVFSFGAGSQGGNTADNFQYALPMIPAKIPGTPAASGMGLQVNPGGQTVYDPIGDVTWLANANLAATNTFGLPICTRPTTSSICAAQDGSMNLASASQFIANMNAYNGAGYLGQTNWELPPSNASCPTFNCADNGNPMGILFYDQFGLSAGMPAVATPNVAVGPFDHLQPYLYWSCQAVTIQDPCQTDGPSTGAEWAFSFGNGYLGTDRLEAEYYVTAYFVGNAATTPFFSGQVSLGSGVEYLQFSNGNLFGYYNLTNFPIFYHYDMGFEGFVDGGNGAAYMYDFASGHWWYTSSSLFPYLYDFTLSNWLYYFPATNNPGHYTTNPRYFSNLTTGKILTM
jgi:hypothetical protein